MLRCDPSETVGKNEVGEGGAIFTTPAPPAQRELLLDLEMACELGDAAAIQEILRPVAGRDWKRTAINKVYSRGLTPLQLVVAFGERVGGDLSGMAHTAPCPSDFW